MASVARVLDDPLVEALVAARQQRQRRLARQLVDQGVVEHPPRGRERDHPPLAAHVERVAAVEALKRGVHHVHAQDHPGPAPNGVSSTWRPLSSL
jgi:hypothetical protein